MTHSTTITAAIDIASDVLLISVPILLLSRVTLKMRQKAALGISVCLSLIMVTVSAVRVAGAELTNGQVDIVWTEMSIVNYY